MTEDQEYREEDRDEAKGGAQDETQGVERDPAVPEVNLGDCSAWSAI